MPSRHTHLHAVFFGLSGRPLLPLFLVVGCLLFGACQKTVEPAPSPARPPVPVQTLTLKAQHLPRMISAVGGLESPQTTQVTADRSGKIVFLDIPEGQEVRQGHVLARIDAAEAQAAVDVAQAHYQNAQLTLERLTKLPPRARSQQALDNAQAVVRTTRGELDEAQTIRRKMTIHAPFTGRLGLRQVSLGTYLEPGEAVVRLTQVHPLHLVFSLPQHYVPALKTSQRIRGVAGQCTSRFTATVSVIDPFLNPDTRSVTVQALVPNEDRTLLPGMAAALRLEVASRSDAISIPLEAIIRQGTKRLVYTLRDEHLAASQPVRLGQFTPRRVEVLSGLKPGDTIIVAGHQKLRPGDRVQPRPYEPVENTNLELGMSRTLLATCDF